MNTIEELPIDDLIKVGIMENDKNFSDALSKKQVNDFINGGTMLVETEKNKFILNLAKNNEGNLELNQSKIVKDYKMSFELDNDENKGCLKNDVINKNIKGYGEIIGIESKPYLNDPENKEKTLLTVENEKGDIQEFWGDDILKKELENFKEGDLIQVDFKGLKVDTFKEKKGSREYQKNENIFKIKPLDKYENGIQKNKLYAYDKNTNQTISFEPKVENIKEINGYALNEKDKRNLKKGKKIELSDGEEVYIDPTIKDNKLKLSNAAKKLLFASVLFDGGLTLALVLGSKKILERNQKEKELLKKENSAKYKASLDKMLAFLQKKKSQYPNEKGISKDINTIKKEKTSMGFSKPSKKENSIKDVKSIQVNDYDHYEEYKDKINTKNEDEEQDNKNERRSSGFKR